MVPGEATQSMAQLRRGATEFCILALLKTSERYGFDLARVLSAKGLIANDGTIYPLLARLRRNGLVETNWKESTEGPPRRYYFLTDEGRSSLKGFSVQWAVFRDSVDEILNERSSS